MAIWDGEVVGSHTGPHFRYAVIIRRRDDCNPKVGGFTRTRDSAASRYVSGHGAEWVKVTCRQRETLTVAGFALDEGKWDGIYLGRRKGKELIYAGKVDHGFDKASSADLQKRLTPLIRKTQPYTKRIAHKGIWVEPKLLAEIEYRAKSAEGKVRHPFLKGLREDLK